MDQIPVSELFDAPGKTMAYVGGNLIDRGVLTANYDKYVGTISASAQFIDNSGNKIGENSYTVPSTEQLAALSGKSWTFKVKAQGNAKIVSSASSVADPGSELEADFAITFDRDTSIPTPVTGSNCFFKINTNNTMGPEWLTAADDKGQVPDGTIANTAVWVSPKSHAAGTSGTIVKISDANGDEAGTPTEVWKLTTVVDANVALTEGSNATSIDHGADLLAVKEDSRTQVS